ncbi:hypothetical protein, partial [Proteus mirabilis]|uniref:hypothetical protein n=1 Tax=Proteus mirabilis TaxID=584 RepID=UPI003316397D
GYYNFLITSGISLLANFVSLPVGIKYCPLGERFHSTIFILSLLISAMRHPSGSKTIICPPVALKYVLGSPINGNLPLQSSGFVDTLIFTHCIR